jgi:hypothetical protein
MPLADRTRRFEFEVKAYRDIDHLTVYVTQAQYRLIATANQWQDNVLDSEQRTSIQKGLKS